MVELDIEYKENAQKLGIPDYKRVPALGTHPSYVEGLRNIVVTAFSQKIEMGPPENTRYCPADTGKCLCT